MELNEVVQRIVVGHWRTLLLCLLVAINVVVARSLLDSTPASSSTARIQASSTPPGSDTEADSVLNRVKGLASSGRVLTQTMQEAGVTNRDVTVLGATGLRVSRLGTSAIVDISVVDRDPGVARKLTDSLAKRVVELLDSSGTERVTSLRTDLQNRRDKVLVDREKKAIELGRMVGAADRVDLQAQVGTLDRETDSLDALLRQLAVSSATSSSATVISEATPPEPVPRHVPTDVALALLLGLVAGLSLCILIEVFRPRVPGGRSFARELGVPLLGAVQSGSKDQQPTPQVPAATDESLRETPLEPRAQPETASEYSAAVSPAACWQFGSRPTEQPSDGSLLLGTAVATSSPRSPSDCPSSSGGRSHMELCRGATCRARRGTVMARTRVAKSMVVWADRCSTPASWRRASGCPLWPGEAEGSKSSASGTSTREVTHLGPHFSTSPALAGRTPTSRISGTSPQPRGGPCSACSITLNRNGNGGGHEPRHPGTRLREH